MLKPAAAMALGLLLAALPSLARAGGGAQGALDPGAPGSHRAFIELLETAREQEFSALLDRYDRHLAAHPRDTVAAIERCRFLQNALYDEVEEVNPHHEDAERCRLSLSALFPRNPDVLLYDLEWRWGEDLIERSETLSRRELSGWTSVQQAELLARTAAAHYQQGHVEQAFVLARRARTLDPGQDVDLILGAGWREAGSPRYAIRALMRNLQTVEPWELHQRARLLIELEAWDQALELLDQAEVRAGWRDELLLARAHEGAGRLAAAREHYLAGAEQEWRRSEALLRVFRIALAGSDAQEAANAYEALRDLGWSADPLLRHRLALEVSFPGSPVRWRDVGGALTLLAALGVSACLPLLLVVPVHYIGLRRGRRTRPDLDGRRRWSARHAWYALALFVVAELVCAYVFLYDELQVWWTVDLLGATEPPEPAPGQLRAYALTFGVLILAGALPLFRQRGDRELVWRCRWSLGRAVGVSVLAVLGLRMLASVIIHTAQALGWSEDGVASMTANMFDAIRQEYGLLGLLGYGSLLVPVYEELLFRGVVLAVASRWLAFGWANLCQAMAFALLHESLVLLPLFVALGAVLGSMRRRSGGLAVVIGVHAAYNALALVGFHLVRESVA